LIAVYQALVNNRILEGLVEGVIMNEGRGTIDVYIRNFVLQNKPYLKDQLLLKLRELVIKSMPVIIPS
jgi:hypothetical protein